MNKKVISFAAAMMLAALPLAAGSAAGFTAGEYEASAQGFGGPVTVKVTVDADTVTAVEVTGEGETPTLGGAAIEGYNTSLVGVTDADRGCDLRRDRDQHGCQGSVCCRAGAGQGRGGCQ